MQNKKTRVIGSIVTIIILIMLVIVSNIKIEKWHMAGNTINSIVLPVQNVLTYLKNKIAGNEAFFVNAQLVKSENEKLKKENEELSSKLMDMEMLKAENNLLKQQMNLVEQYEEYKSIPGYVIQKDISNYGRTIVINRGVADGVKSGMVVVSEQGLVGYVISTSEKSAKVQTIIDTATAVSSVITSTRDSIVVRGMLDSEANLKGTHIPTTANLLEGDTIETSGIGGIYPKGIKIGRIVQIINTNNIIDRYAVIETAVDFTKLENVLIIDALQK